ncbi:MAG: hypothetical protein ACI865_000455 [Flavobacteriaceae bacterium]|jgi:hypothetical protein
MKLYCALLVLILTTSYWSTAQIETTPKLNKWKISSFGIEAGMIRDSYAKMDLESMSDFTKNPALLDRNLDGYTENLYRESSGRKLGANVVITRTDPSSRLTHEIRLGAFYSEREPFISYNSNDFDATGEYSSIIYCNVVHEASLDGAYILRRSVKRAKWFSTYVGIGATLGASFNNKLVVMENTVTDADFNFDESHNETYDAKESIFTRLYLPVGIQATILGKVNVGIESNIGIGLQSVIKGKSYCMPLNTGLTLKLGYNL